MTASSAKSFPGCDLPGRPERTLAMLQTPPGRGGIAVIEIAGPQSGKIVERIFRPLAGHVESGRGRLQLGRIVAGDNVVDEAVVHQWKGGAEINIHGGPAVAAAVMELIADSGAEVIPAEPSAIDPDGCGFNPAHGRWNNPAIGMEMLRALPSARSSAAIAAVTAQWFAGLSRLACDNNATAGQFDEAARRLSVMEKLLNPREVVLVGPPNAGKSALTNVLVGRDVSIVHHESGTTRDWVREAAVFDGVPLWLTDTAGLWKAPKGVDAEAVARARRRAEAADLVLLLNAEEPAPAPRWLDETKIIYVWSKADLSPPPDDKYTAVSATDQTGLEELRSRVLAEIGLGDFDASDAMAFTPRQAELLRRAAEAMRRGDEQETKTALKCLLEDEESPGSCL